jgi:hypothetical protein
LKISIKSKEMAGVPLTLEHTRQLNSMLNVLDFPKDAQEPFVDPDTQAPTNLSEGVHGAFLKRIYGFLCHASDLSRLGEKTAITGVGDKRAVMERNINRFKGLKVRQQFTPLRFGGETDMRLHNINFAIDVGLGLEHIGDESCKSIITPASIIDPGTRNRSPPAAQKVDLLQELTISFDTGLYSLLRMEKYVKKIHYKPRGSNHDFTVTFADAINKPPMSFTYDANGKSTEDLIVNSKNAKRNQQVYLLFKNYTYLSSCSPAELDTLIANLNTPAPTTDMKALMKAKFNGDDDDAAELLEWMQEIVFEIFWKELCDTLQVMIVNQYMNSGTQGLRPDTTAVSTNDTVVLYRCIVNGVACLFHERVSSCFYPILDGIHRSSLIPKVTAIRSIKAMLFKNIVEHNEGVLRVIKGCKQRTLRDDFGIPEFDTMGYIDSKYVTEFEASERMEMISLIMEDLFIAMTLHVEPFLQAIKNILSPHVESDSVSVEVFRRESLQYMIQCPFRINQANSSIGLMRGFRQFLLTPISVMIHGRRVTGTEPFDFYKTISALYRKDAPSIPIIKPIFGLVPGQQMFIPQGTAGNKRSRGPEEERSQKKRGGGSSQKRTLSEDKAQLLENLFKKSHMHPNFLLYVITLYAPELLYMAYAYELALDSGRLADYTYIFTYTGRERLLAPFDGDGIPESGSLRKNTDSICLHACALLHAMHDKEATLFDLCEEYAPEVIWIINHVETYYKVPKASSPRKEQVPMHDKAMMYYKELYMVDVILCILNERTNKNPIAFVHAVKDSVPSSEAPASPPATKADLDELQNDLETENMSPGTHARVKKETESLTHKVMSSIKNRTRSAKSSVGSQTRSMRSHSGTRGRRLHSMGRTIKA